MLTVKSNLTGAVFIAVALFCINLHSADTIIPVPPQEDLLKTLRKEHPRLVATKADFDRVKNLIRENQTLAKWYKEIQSSGERILIEPPSQYEIPDGLRLLATSRRVMNRIYTLGFLYRMDNNKKWAERAWKELETAANFKDWNTRHFLDTAEMTHAFGIGYDWFYDVWSDQQKRILVQAMVEKGIKPAIEVHKKNTWWSRARHNWNQVCNGGIGVGVLAIADIEPQLASEFLHYALQSIQLAMAEYGPDGAWAEGPGYWNYATSYNVYFLSALETALGTDFNLSKIPGFDRAGDFPVFATGPLGRTFNYADSGDGAPHSPCLFWLAKKFNNPIYALYESRESRASALDLLWYQSPGNASFSSLPLDKYFRKAEVVCFRSKWDSTDAIFVGFKGGDNKANHSHLDLGTFVMDALGKRWAVDIGADNYNLPGYFGKQRWTYYRLRAEGHNTIVLNPGQEPDQIPSAEAKIIKFESKPERAFAIADLTAAYKTHATSVKRGIMLIDRNRVLIQDEIQTLHPAQFYWFMHTPAKIEVDSKSPQTAVLTQGDSRLIARIVSPSGAHFVAMNAEPLPESPKPEKQANNNNIRKLAIKIRDASNLRLVVDLYPVKGSENLPPVQNVVPLEKW